MNKIDARKRQLEYDTAVLLNGIRWANNILVEILSLHARRVDQQGADLLAESVSKLADAERKFRGHL